MGIEKIKWKQRKMREKKGCKKRKGENDGTGKEREGRIKREGEMVEKKRKKMQEEKESNGKERKEGIKG